MNRVSSLALVAALTASLCLPTAHATEEEDLAAAKQSLLEVVGQPGETLLRARRVKRLAGFDNEAAALGLAEALDLLSKGWGDREEKAAETREKFEKYKGYSFKDPRCTTAYGKA